ncbi:MAG: hypothetical protein ACLQU1_22555 [Bryobacteraceae bacterium]
MTATADQHEASSAQAGRQAVLGLLRSLGRVLQRALRSASRRRLEDGSWIEGVGRAIADLDRMNRSTEAGFLAVGEKLSGFLAAARQVSASAAATAERVSGEQGQRDFDALVRVREQTAEMRKYAEAVADLSQLRDSAIRLRHVFAGFDHTVASFRVLAVLARIETARLGESGAGLAHLTEEMRGRSDDIASRTGRFLDTAATLDRRVEEHLNRIADLDARQLKALPPLMDAVARNFAALRDRRELGEAAAARLGAQFAELSEAIGDVVTSVQFHDITRQQIEHAIESLQQLHDHAGQGYRDAPTPEQGAVIELQLAQLDNARRTFLTSIGQIDGRLETVARRMSEMAAESQNLAGQAQGRNESSFAEMMGCFAGILDAAGECGSFEQGARTALAELRQAIQALGEALADIGAIELHLKRLSLNAAIQAVHLGAAGEPFNAVAGAMHSLQADCETRSGQSRVEMDSIGAALRAMVEQGMASQSRQGTGIETAVDDLQARIEEMCVANERGIASCQEIGSLVGRLLADIQSAQQDLAESRALTEAVDGCCETLRRVGQASACQPLLRRMIGWNAARPPASSAANSAASPGPGVTPELQLAECTRNYTMRAEHEVHRELTGCAPAASGPAQASPSNGELELF